MTSRPLAWVAAASLAVAMGCTHEAGPPPLPPPPPPPPVAPMPSAVTSHAGEGPIAVFGASVYSPGQEIYKALRQEDSLMGFLACQGEPDRLEVREGDDPDGPPRIILEYTRRSVQRGTVEIEPTASGYYAARPIDPSGRLATGSKPSEAPTHPSKPASSPKASQAKSPSAETEGKPAPDSPAPPPEAQPAPQPTSIQRDECPIEPWRSDCRSLCVQGASWEWCSYRD